MLLRHPLHTQVACTSKQKDIMTVAEKALASLQVQIEAGKRDGQGSKLAIMSAAAHSHPLHTQVACTSKQKDIMTVAEKALASVRVQFQASKRIGQGSKLAIMSAAAHSHPLHTQVACTRKQKDIMTVAEKALASLQVQIEAGKRGGQGSKLANMSAATHSHPLHTQVECTSKQKEIMSLEEGRSASEQVWHRKMEAAALEHQEKLQVCVCVCVCGFLHLSGDGFDEGRQRCASNSTSRCGVCKSLASFVQFCFYTTALFVCTLASFCVRYGIVCVHVRTVLYADLQLFGREPLQARAKIPNGVT